MFLYSSQLILFFVAGFFCFLFLVCDLFSFIIAESMYIFFNNLPTSNDPVCWSISEFSIFVKISRNLNKISTSEMNILKKWRQNPSKWTINK